MENYRKIAIEDFNRITKYDLYTYFVNVSSFLRVDFTKISNWFNLITDKPNSQSFKNLQTLLNESKVVSNLMYINKQQFSKMYHWDLLTYLEDIKVTLETSNNLSKRLRSVRLNYNDFEIFDYTTKKYQTLEEVQRGKISTNSSDDRWVDIALRNELLEEDYDQDGGVDLILPLVKENNIFLESVVDNMIGEKLNGLDFNRKITFKTNDFDILSYNETATQSVEILISIRQMSVPEFSTLGIKEDMAVGGNLASLNIPGIKRQLGVLFKTDDSLVDFVVNKITQEQDSTFIDFSVNTVRGKLIQNKFAV